MQVALFDMDGTLVRAQTARLYLRYQRDQGESTLSERAQVAWWLLRYSVGLLDAVRVAEKALAGLHGTPEATMVQRCEACFERYVVSEVTLRGSQTVRAHQQAGDITAIVTAASPYMANPLARYLGIDHVIATELEVQNHLLTGRALAPLCYGEGKTARVTRWGQQQGFALTDCTFYSDSITDLPLLLAVGRPVVVNPDVRLRQEARRRRWPIEIW